MKRVVLMTIVISVLIITPSNAFGAINLGPEELVEANDIDIEVPGYSVPTFVDWDNDGIKDLIVGEGGMDANDGITYPGKVRVYLNAGTESSPQFSNYFYAEADWEDLTVPAVGCMGCFPRVVYWNPDTLKDLLVGQADGTVKIFINTYTESNPRFDSGYLITVGRNPASQLDAGNRATPAFVDWDSDGLTDLVVGALDGKIHAYINCGCEYPEPAFYAEVPLGRIVQENDANLIVPSYRSSPEVLDLDGDGKKDLLTGNTDGQLLFYSNVGSDEDPNFSGYSYVRSNGLAIDLPGTRSRPYVCYWTDDAYLDVLIGASDGKIHLYQGIPEGDMDSDGNVDFYDFAEFGLYWQQTNCGDCGGADLTYDGNVDCNDLGEFVSNWLTSIE